MRMNVKNFQPTQAAIAKMAKEFEDMANVLVGIRGEAGNAEGGDITLAQLGAIHEFGAPNIPPRPWLIPGAKSAEKDIEKAVVKFFPEDGPDKTMEKIGLIAQNAIQNYIVELKTPPNAPATIERKNSSNPLIDTGTMLNSVTYVVTKENLVEGL